MRKSCPICKSENSKMLKRIRFEMPAYFHLPNEYDVVSCEECGFCYAATEATLEDYDYYYSHCNFYSGILSDSNPKMEFNQKMVKLVEDLFDKEQKFLDVGYGKGNFMRLLRKHGFPNTYGMDPSSESIEAMQVEGFTVYQGSIYDDAMEGLQNKFDCIFLFDVLEHLLYPDRAIKKISYYLKEKGCLLISVPNYAALWNDDSILTNQFNQEHINYFSRVSLDNLMKKEDFYQIDRKEIGEAQVSEKGLLAIYEYRGGGVKNAACKRNGINILKDESGRKSIENYIERNNKLESTVNDKIVDYSKKINNDSVYVWGTGSYVMWLLANTRLRDLNIEAFIDNNATKAGKMLLERPIITADQISENIPILICSMRFHDEIENQIRKNLTNECFVL